MFAVFNIYIIFVTKLLCLTNEASGVFIGHNQDTLQTGSIIKLYIVIKQSGKNRSIWEIKS